jgi:hypothetical protein
VNGHTSSERLLGMAGIGKKIEGEAKKAAKGKVSGGKKGKGGSKSGVGKAEKALKKSLK